MNPGELGACLQAYSEALPGILALRACSRLADTACSMLPTLALEFIERRLIESYQADCASEWYHRSKCLGWNWEDRYWLSQKLWALGREGTIKDVLLRDEFRCPSCSDRTCGTCLAIIADPDAIDDVADLDYRHSLEMFFEFLQDADLWKAYNSLFVDEHYDRLDQETFFSPGVLSKFGLKTFTIVDDDIAHHDRPATSFYLIPQEAAVFTTKEVSGLGMVGPYDYRRRAIGSREMVSISESSFRARLLRLRRELDLTLLDAVSQVAFETVAEIRPRMMALVTSPRQEASY